MKWPQGASAGEHGGFGGLHGHDVEPGKGGLEGAAAAGEGAARAIAGDDGVGGAVVLGDAFGPGVLGVVESVERVFELAREKNARVARGEFAAEFDAGGVAAGGGEEPDLAASCRMRWRRSTLADAPMRILTR